VDQRDFIARADACLAKIAKWLDDFDPDEVDYDLADGALTIEFADGTRFILSRQAATSQLWLAAGAHGFHYGYDAAGDAWIDDKDGHELRGKLAELIAEKLGRPVEA
jgi:iron-sulfur cluster assembly protein CyaY